MELQPKEKSIREQFPKTSEELLQILELMLGFNHYFRPTARELLKNKIFDKIRIPSIEEPSPHKIVIDIDKNEYKQTYDDEEDDERDKEIIEAIQVNIVKDFMKLTKINEDLKIKVIYQ